MTLNKLWAGPHLAALMARAGVSDEALADAADCTSYSIRRYKAGSSVPSAIRAYLIARRLGCRMEDFFRPTSRRAAVPAKRPVAG